MSITATIFIPPTGRKEIVEIEDISSLDEAWFKEHNAKLSLEYLTTDQIAVYADIGLGEDDEAIEINFGRSCRDTLTALRMQCERMLAKAAKAK